VLKQRVLTALLLVAVLLTVMLGLPPIGTVVLLTVLVLVGAWEWAAFLGAGDTTARALYTGAIALALAAALWLHSQVAGFVSAVMMVAMAWWLIAFLWISLAPTRVNRAAAAAAGFLALVPCWLALVYVTLTTDSTVWVMFTLALVWAADTGAFFAGRWFGRVPLAPRVSPKKTWEGVIGGLLVSGLVAFLAATYLFTVDTWTFTFTCVGIAAISVVGDLAESMLKRAAGLKDSGTFFPGHGGVLDRIDSVTAAAPALVFALLGLGVVS
jgi:phosphatidate cytidylyltransferase